MNCEYNFVSEQWTNINWPLKQYIEKPKRKTVLYLYYIFNIHTVWGFWQLGSGNPIFVKCTSDFHNISLLN